MSTFASVVRFSATAASILLAASVASAAPPSKEECVEAHGKGQDAREAGQFSQAGKLFLTCAQSTCPALVQSDCARFVDELSRVQPSITFAARDGAGADLPDTAVYVDGVLVVARLDGAAHDVDPGSHVIKFQHGTKDQIVTVVVASGEKGRSVAAVFAAPVPSPAVAAAKVEATASKPAPLPPAKQHPSGAKALALAGATIAIGGAGLAILGVVRMPAGCSLSTAQCTAAPGDPAFANASSAARLVDVGIAAGVVGVAAFAAGAYWYVSGASDARATKKERMAITPWAGPGGAGLSLQGGL